MPNKLKDEDYWWDILKTVISFSITGILAYSAALTLGYVKTPAGREVGLTILSGTICLIVGILIGKGFAEFKKENPRPWVMYATVGAFFVILAGNAICLIFGLWIYDAGMTSK